MTDAQSGPLTRSISPPFRTPKLLCALGLALLVCSALLACIRIFYKLALARPSEPWEAAFVLEGWRFAAGLPLYEPREQGHATLTYGPAEPIVLGWFYSLFSLSNLSPSLSNLAPKMLEFLSSAGTVILCLSIVKRFLSTFCLILAALSLVAIETRVQFFSEGRPDFSAWLFGCAGLIFLYQDLYGKVSYRYFLGVILLLIAVTFKQTAAMLVIIPPIVIFIEERNSWNLLRLALSLGPILGVFLFFFYLYFFAPTTFFYMVDAPRGYPINWGIFLKRMLELLLWAPCLWYGVGVVSASPQNGYNAELWRRTSWAIAALIVAFVLATWTNAKQGASYNTLIPWWFSLIIVFWLLISTKLGGLTSVTTATFEQSIYMLFSAITLTLTLSPQRFHDTYDLFKSFSTLQASNLSYREVILHAKDLNGTVYSPEDPTIVLYAKGRVTRSLFAENDSSWWSALIPSYMYPELQRADYLITVASWPLDYAKAVIQPSALADMGFQLSWSNGLYGIWHRGGSEPPVSPK